jgi:hypothetical protein
MSREKRICLMAGSLLASSPQLSVQRALLVAGRIVDLVIRLAELGLRPRKLLTARNS